MSDPVIDRTMAVRIATQLGWEPKREWVGLTDAEIMASLPSALRAPPLKMPPGWRQFADALEAILKEKNNASS